MFLGLQDPDLDPLVRGMDPDIEDALCCISFSTLRTSVPDTDPNPDPDSLDPHVFGIADPEPNPSIIKQK